MTRPAGDSRAGYALLLVYAMAATIAVMLLMQLPRVAFEAQRDKEQLLIDRGEQYSRAVQLFVRKYNRFPQDIAALENTQNIRFLRHKYKDPITGKDEWREIHVGPGGIFTDSLVYGKKKKGDQNAPQTFIAEMQQIGGNGASGQEGVNLALRKRPSDQAGATGDPGSGGSNPAFPNNGQPFSGNNGSVPPNGSQQGQSGPVMVLPDGRIVSANSTGQASPPGQGVFSGQPGQNIQPPGQQPGQGFPPNGFPPGFQPPSGMGVQQGFNQQPGQPQFGNPNGFQNQPNAPPSAAANLINQILTSPRPGGLNGNQNNTGTPAGQGLGGQTIGGGFAGVASKHEQEGIKIYRERTAYNEWEFVYDMSKDTNLTGGGRGGVNPQVPGQPGQPGQSGQQQAPLKP
jgi:hypothetical protein